jgi:hypothetical protein
MKWDTFNYQFLGLCEYFNKEHSEAVVYVYWNALQHLTDEQFTKAVCDVVIKNTFFPRIPELLKLVPESLQIESKASVTCCENTKKLMERYPYVRQVQTA